MTRKQNYERGAMAEERIRGIIKDFAQVEPTSRRYPDLMMRIGDKSYAVECKSLVAVNNGNGGRKGNVTISSTEIDGMNALITQEIIPCMIVEIRPPWSGPAPKSYFYIPWSLVREKYDKKRPVTLSLTFYWILQNGENLRLWLSRQCSTPVVSSTQARMEVEPHD